MPVPFHLPPFFGKMHPELDFSYGIFLSFGCFVYCLASEGNEKIFFSFPSERRQQRVSYPLLFWVLSKNTDLWLTQKGYFGKPVFVCLFLHEHFIVVLSFLKYEGSIVIGYNCIIFN